MPQTSAPHHSNLRPHGPLFSILSPQLHHETLLCPNPQTLTPGKWLWWKATQKPSSIYTLCFLTEHSQTVTCGIETTTGIFPLFIFLGGGFFPYLNDSLLVFVAGKKTIQRSCYWFLGSGHVYRNILVILELISVSLCSFYRFHYHLKGVLFHECFF